VSPQPSATSEGADGAQALLDRYEAIHAHAELELELAGAGEVDRLAGLDGRWEELIEGLPTQPPLAAAEVLHRARLIHDRTRIELERLRETLLEDLATTTRSKRAADGYSGQLRRRPRLDRRA
jgi:GAF domain-containing protein